MAIGDCGISFLPPVANFCRDLARADTFLVRVIVAMTGSLVTVGTSLTVAGLISSVSSSVTTSGVMVGND